MKDGKGTTNSIVSFIKKFNRNLQVELSGAELRLVVHLCDSHDPIGVNLSEYIKALPDKPPGTGKKKKKITRLLPSNEGEGKEDGETP
jgi:hypothetical protein